jgi:GH25 family lysozyme M1 (1,4-beta-N-acetylmuramidase)
VIVEGVDVSRSQQPDDCDWIEAAASGLRFAWIKGSEGRGGSGAYVDPSAVAHASRIRRSVVVPGMYHFARPDNRFVESQDGYANGVSEGEHAARTAFELGLVERELPIALDLEKYSGKDSAGKPIANTQQRDDMVRGTVDTIERLTGRLPVVYTGAGFWGYQHSQWLADELHDRGVLLWLVSYSRASDPPKTITGWPWSFWQWSGGGDFEFAEAWPGLPSPIDRNRYRGSASEFAGLVGR